MALDKLIARELLYLDALGRGVVASSADVEREMEKAVKDYPSEEVFVRALQKAGIDAATFQRILRKDATVNRITEQLAGECPEPDEKRIARFYDEHRDQLKRPARVRASHILVPVEEGSKEEALREIERLQQECREKDFAAVAAQHSRCPSASKGGDLGYFRHREMVKSFADAAFGLDVGQTSPVVETDFGLHLIKVTDREEEQPLSLQEAEPQIRDYLRQESVSKALEQRVEKLKGEAVIEIVAE
nr:hypothetical protein [Desulfuromonadales bacterium]